MVRSYVKIDEYQRKIKFILDFIPKTNIFDTEKQTQR